ncbi:MAG: tetratricopeptide repeat protein [Xanthobacteraceae bacterium]
MRLRGIGKFCIGVIAVAFALMPDRPAHAAGDYAPENIDKTLRQLGWLCLLPPICPANSDLRKTMARASANEPSAEYLLGLTLLTGDGLPADRDAGVLWIARAAEHGEPAAARDIAGRIRNGANIKIDETKVADALKPQVEAGNVEAMRALGPMYIGGRGVKQDPAMGIGLIKRAAIQGSSDAETDLAQLYLNGAPGLAANRPEAMKWFATSASHGNIGAMVSLGYMSVNAGIGTRDLAAGYCWLMRAALLDDVRAHEKLSLIFADGEKDERTVIAADLVQADLWFKLAARSPYHDNSQIRAAIEPKMTTDQQNEARRLFDAWRPVALQDLKTTVIKLPGGAVCPAMG